MNGRLRQVDRVDVVEHDLGVEALGVLQEALHQVGALHAVDVGRPVVDVGRRHQLAALRDAGDQHRLQVGARGVDRRRCSRPGRSRGSGPWRAGCGVLMVGSWSSASRWRASLTWGAIAAGVNARIW